MRATGLLLATSLVIAACAPEEEPVATPEEEPDDVDPDPDTEDGPAWSFEQDLSGVDLTIMIHPSFYEGIGGDDGLVQEFEEISGASVEVVITTEQFDRQMVEFEQQSSTFDVVFPIYGDMHATYRQHLEPLNDWIERAPPEWDYDSIIPGVQDGLIFDGEVMSLLFRWGVEGLVYRQDLYDEAGVSVPTTFDEIDETARAVHEATGHYGWVTRGVGFEMVQDWLSLYATVGGTLFEEDGITCAVNTPEGVHVLETVVSWLEDGVIAEDTLAVGRDDSVALIQQDRAAQGFFFGPRYPLMIGDDSLPVVQENLLWPDEHPGELARNTPQSVAMVRYSENKEAAWALIEYILHPDNTPRHVLEWSGSLNRTTDLEHPEVQERFPIYDYWIAAADNSYVEPPDELFLQMQDIMNEELTAAYLGSKSAADALADACQRLDALR